MKTHALIRMIALSALLVLAAPVLGNAAASKSGDGKAAPAQSAPAPAARQMTAASSSTMVTSAHSPGWTRSMPGGTTIAS